MTQPIDIIASLRQKRDEGTPAERRLAQTILDDPFAAARAPIAELARRADVSEPSVTRLARAMQLDGTHDLKLQLAQAVAIGGAYLNTAGEAVNLGKSRASVTVAAAAHKAIDEVQATLDEALLDRIADRLVRARQVLVVGTGGISSVMAQELTFRLFRFGMNVTTEVDGRLQRMHAALANEGSVVVGLSVSGGAASVIDALTLAGQYGASTVAITPPDSALAHAAEFVIPFHHVEDGMIYKPTSARFGLLTIVDTLALMTAEKFGPEVVELLRRMRHGLSLADAYDGRLPLGD